MTGIAVAVLPDAGAPQVGITVDGLSTSSPSVITVDVSWDGLTWLGVRGAQAITVNGAVFLRDYVPPLNLPVTYRLTVLSGPTIPATLQASITVPSPYGWVQDPLDPRSAVPVSGYRTPDALLLLSTALAEVHRVQVADVVAVMQARLPVASVGVRLAPSDVPLIVRAIVASQGALVKSLQALLDSAGTLVLRGLPADVPLDPVAHVVAAQVTEAPVVGGLLGYRNDWELSVSQVRPTSLAVAVPWFTYDQVKALWAPATYAEAVAARPGQTYLDWARDPSRP